MQKDWMKDPRVQNIDPAKRQLLLTLIANSKGKKQKDILPFLTQAMTEAKKKNLSLTSEESSLLIEVLMENMTPEEQFKAKQFLKMAEKAKEQAKKQTKKQP